ncbi:MAG: copper amine oxidase N-terminal domain-containing protein [Clostridiales bacterium]|jgi:hypothetical protein|nr:copper amine oxidase N-terminal domain-containing protein [Clostridiales bacterium]
MIGGVFIKLTKFFRALSIIAFITCPNIFIVSAAEPETNLAGITLSPFGEAGVISYNDSTTEEIGSNYVALFINGSIIKNSNLVTENNRTLVPLRLISENLGAKAGWDPGTKKVTIVDGSVNIELFIGNTKATINGKEYTLDVAPKIFNNYTYVPARFIAEALKSTVDYFDGGDGGGIKIFPRIRQVMISRYPEGAKIIPKEEAIEIVRGELILAYEKKFAPYTPWPGPEITGEGQLSELWVKEGDAGFLRHAITHLKITGENDRYYVIPVVFDFWLDKYTGGVYVFYNGYGMAVWKFDPNQEGALAFAG